ncbi:MAG TPA: FTR1 family protein [Bacillota bacterium]|nr:FTR1 family protein [Bacillota bacterium]
MKSFLHSRNVLLGAGAALVLAVLVWQALSSGGVPNPTLGHPTWAAAVVDTAVLVFREGLEAVLTLAVLTAGLARSQRGYGKPVAIGAGLGLIATGATWVAVVAIIALVDNTRTELAVQAATGLLAVVVLLVVMNWFFHKIYWESWMAFHSRTKRALVKAPAAAFAWRGLILLGLASIYREGFEVVLFLQSIRLQVGSGVIAVGAAVGLGLTAMVALLTFLGHRRLPYQKMLAMTGGMLALVLVVMVGEQAFEMQQAGWLGTTPLNIAMAPWLGLWLSVFPTVQTLAAQALAIVLVLGSYLGARGATLRQAHGLSLNWSIRSQASSTIAANQPSDRS